MVAPRPKGAEQLRAECPKQAAQSSETIAFRTDKKTLVSLFTVQYSISRFGKYLSFLSTATQK